MTLNFLPIEEHSLSGPRQYYGRVTADFFRLLWDRKLLAGALLAICMAAEMLIFTLMPPYYTGEAVIRVEFNRPESPDGDKIQSTASVDAGAEVTSAARLLHSRSVASDVVSALRLDEDPSYTRPTHFERAVSGLRAGLSAVFEKIAQLTHSDPAQVTAAFKGAQPSAHDRAVDRLMRQIAVTNDARSYLITVAVTAYNPDVAATLANRVASEYLRRRLQQQATQEYAAAERELSSAAAVLGPKHPKYLAALAKLDRRKSQLSTGQDAPAGDAGAAGLVEYAASQYLFSADPITKPAGPIAVRFFGLTTLASLTVIIGLLWGLSHVRFRP